MWPKREKAKWQKLVPEPGFFSLQSALLSGPFWWWGSRNRRRRPCTPDCPSWSGPFWSYSFCFLKCLHLFTACFFLAQRTRLFTCVQRSVVGSCMPIHKVSCLMKYRTRMPLSEKSTKVQFRQIRNNRWLFWSAPCDAYFPWSRFAVCEIQNLRWNSGNGHMSSMRIDITTPTSLCKAVSPSARFSQGSPAALVDTQTGHRKRNPEADNWPLSVPNTYNLQPSVESN